MKIFDITLTITPDLPVWEGDSRPEIRPEIMPARH